jgi:histone acetyltransferase
METAPPITAPPTNLYNYYSRESKHLEREASGEIQAKYVSNDGSPENGILLIGLKNIFSKCLPNMPKEYICRLLFERRHRSVVIVRNNTQVIGGITYRPFYGQKFAEIAFCAVAQTLQVSGYGTRLMNWTKQYAREQDECEYFLTYADNNAVGYFSKQGFTKTISMERTRWFGYIKDYDGGTLMECAIHPTLPFTDLPGLISQQKQALEGEVRKHSSGHVVYPGIHRWREHVEKTGSMETAAHQVTSAIQEIIDKNRLAEEKGLPPPKPLTATPAMPPPDIDWHSRPEALDIQDIPGIVEAGWNAAMNAAVTARAGAFSIAINGTILEPTKANMHQFMSLLLNRLTVHEDIWPFRTPVNAWEVPDYYTLIKDPIDMTLLEKRVECGRYYVTLDQFIAEVGKMFDNCRLYNSPDTIFFKVANRLHNAFKAWIRESLIYDIQ